jgi:hypothetical protein
MPQGVAGIDSRGPVHLDFEGQVLERAPLPYIGAGHTLEDLRWHLTEASWALRDGLLAGPGGVTWDLQRGKPLFGNPVWRLGATVATAADWATVDWESGEGWWVHPRTGVVTDRFALPIGEDIVERGWEVDGGVAFATTGGAFEVQGSEVTRTATIGPLPHPIAIADWPEAEGSAELGGRRFIWNTAGLLLAL